MSHHEINEEELNDLRSKTQINLWNRVFLILDDIESRIETLESKPK